MKRSSRHLFLASALALATNLAHAQAYPTKPIRMVLTIGGGIEAAIRSMSNELSKGLGQPVVNEVQSGAGGGVEIGRAHV